MSRAGSDTTVEILRDIRDEIRGLRVEQTETNKRLDTNDERLAVVESTLNERLGMVETTSLDLAEQSRFVVRCMRAISAS